MVLRSGLQGGKSRDAQESAESFSCVTSHLTLIRSFSCMLFWHYTYTHLFARWLCAHKESVHIFVCRQLCKVTWSAAKLSPALSTVLQHKNNMRGEKETGREFLLPALTVEWIWGPLQGYGEGKVFKDAPFSSYFGIFLLGTEIYFGNRKTWTCFLMGDSYTGMHRCGIR